MISFPFADNFSNFFARKTIVEKSRVAGEKNNIISSDDANEKTEQRN